MTYIVYDTLGINQADEGNAGDVEVPDELVLGLPSQQRHMHDPVPPLVFYSIFDFFLVIVHTHSKYPHLPLPRLLIFGQHLLVVLHRLLARTAPCRPDIHQQHLSSAMLKQSCSLIKHILYLTVFPEFLPYSQRLLNLAIDVLAVNYLLIYSRHLFL